MVRIYIPTVSFAAFLQYGTNISLLYVILHVEEKCLLVVFSLPTKDYTKIRYFHTSEDRAKEPIVQGK